MVGAYTKHSWLVLLLLAGGTGEGCGHSRSTEAKIEHPVVNPIPEQRDADDAARFLAGMLGKPGTPYAKWESDPVWQKHHQLLDKAWHGAEGSLIAELTAFQKQELDRTPMVSAPVFYPFGGPDALTPIIFFPRSPSYVIVALEPTGTLPTSRKLEKKHLAEYLPALRNTMGSLLGRSFFITRDMDRQFRGQVTDGLMIPILQIVVRTGHTIQSVRYLTLSDAGIPVERPAEFHTNSRHDNKGFELSYRSDADGSTHHLTYYSVNLDDKHLADNDAFRKFAGRLKGSTTMFKATSYMLHKKEFATIGQIALSTSGAILQDDSGLPYNLFDAAKWKLQLYGKYTQPYGSFRFRVQKDLRRAYQSAGVKPLPMRIGYGYGKMASNLLLALQSGS